jgi:predicted lipid-binding transport protein (Tim44 family)
MKKIYAALLALAIAIAPVVAEARAGSSFGGGSRSFSSSRSYSAPSRPSYSNNSYGSKGSNTYKPTPTYQPIQRSVTPPPVAQAPRYTPPAAATTTAPTSTVTHTTSTVGSGAPGIGSTFMAAAGGGLVGSMLGNAMSGNHGGGTTVVNGGGYPTGGGYAGAGAVPMEGGGYAAPVAGGYAPVASHYGVWSFLGDLIGFIIIIAVLAFIVWGIIKLIGMYASRREETQVSDYQQTYSPADNIAATVTKDDKIAFKKVLTDVQSAWSNRDMGKLSSVTTEEVAEYFGEVLEGNTRQGVINKVDGVRDIEVDVLEAWEEQGTKYATVIMRWNALDYTTDLKGVTIDKGSRSNVRETWTFVQNSYGTWVLSAVQQMED